MSKNIWFKTMLSGIILAKNGSSVCLGETLLI